MACLYNYNPSTRTYRRFCVWRFFACGLFFFATVWGFGRIEWRAVIANEGLMRRWLSGLLVGWAILTSSLTVHAEGPGDQGVDDHLQATTLERTLAEIDGGMFDGRKYAALQGLRSYYQTTMDCLKAEGEAGSRSGTADRRNVQRRFAQIDQRIAVIKTASDRGGGATVFAAEDARMRRRKGCCNGRFSRWRRSHPCGMHNLMLQPWDARALESTHGSGVDGSIETRIY